jgi:hypothetical protein
LQELTASASATLDFTSCISSAYDEYEIELINVLPATDSVILWMRMSTDGGATYDAGATAYRTAGWRFHSGAGSAAEGASTSRIHCNGIDAVDNASAWGGLTGTVQLFNPSGSAYKQVSVKSRYLEGTGTVHEEYVGGGTYASATAVNAFRFLFSSGNITSGTIRVYGVAKAGLPVSQEVNGRLTLTTGLPITTADVTAATNIYFTPLNGNVVTLWNSTLSLWQTVAFSETTLALGTLTSGKCYDVFGYLSSGVLALEALVWTSDLVRATAVTLQDGRYCKSGDKTRLYLGTFYTTSTTTTEDSLTKRYLFNQYNRVKRPCAGPTETTDSWNYSTTTWRQARATATNQFEYVNGDPGHYLQALCQALQSNSSGGVGHAVGVGVDSTTVNGAKHFGNGSTSASGLVTMATYRGYPGIGKHYIAWLEFGNGGTQTWYGDGGQPTVYQSGISGEVDL